MRTRFVFAALIGLGTIAAATAPADAQINRRQHHEQRRIFNGVRGGDLNGRETYRLERQQAHIARYERRSRADGNGLSFRERARINRMQNRASRNIYRQKHDGQGN